MKNYLILSQYRDNSEYNDFIGILYHFPKKHKNYIQPGSEFIYYEPSKKGKGVYFGYGKIESVFEDKKETDHYYAKVVDYQPFKNEVPLKDANETLHENKEQYNAQNAVRYTTKEIIENICKKGGLRSKNEAVSFKTRARTVDMLGRQQIAGIPTAINELFKNAHDAYADDVLVDYYVSDGLFVLRDDGLGMTLDDFINRWLTLGTDSKVDVSRSLIPPPKDPTKEDRPSMGEKGIGRLAISIIGPQVLILTRAKRFVDNKESYYDLVAAFINWKMFEIPGVNIDEITIPIKTFSSGTFPDASDVSDMIQEVKDNLSQLSDKVPEDLFHAISNELEQFTIDPLKEAEFLKEPDLRVSSGTHFYILPSDPIIKEDLNVDKTEYSRLHKHLLGFTNTMTPNHKAPKIKAAFKWHNRSDDLSINILEEEEFFTPQDFLNADHRFEGVFDEYGTFHGKVSMYGQEAIEYHLPWNGAKGKEVVCGSFSLNFAAIQGQASETSIPMETYKILKEKCDHIGGLYIYKNGIRVLPYGDNDFDFLEIEKRRSFNAGDWYFSYRKMFGAIEINHTDNKELREKAGREGFQENKAYRQFRDILVHFLKKVAQDFTHNTGIYSDMYLEEKEELKKADKRRKRIEKRKSEKLKQFLTKFKTALENIQALKHVDEVDALIKNLHSEIDNRLTFSDNEKLAYEIIALEKKYLEKFKEIEQSYIISRPTGVTIKTKRDNDLWITYKSEKDNAIETVFNPKRQEISSIISQAIETAQLEIDRRKRIEQSLDEIYKETKKEINEEKKVVSEKKEEVKKEVEEATKHSIKTIEEAIRTVAEDFNKTDFSGMSEDEIAAKRLEYEETIEKVSQREKKTLETISALLEGVDWEFDDEGNIISDLDVQEANERILSEVQEQHKLDMELAQVGIAINIINHEFDSSIRTVRRNLRRLKAWADVNENIASIYNDVRSGFEHIDGYLSLFTPLNRRLYRKEIDIKGYEISDFIENLFKVRFERHDITFKVTDSFRKHSEKGFPSTFYPVFINLVDNSIYWLKPQRKDKDDNVIQRIITFDTFDDHFIVSDNGPGIRKKIKEVIFDFGFSSKAGGRGMGLYIAKESLNELGYDIQLLDTDKGATFEILKKDEENE